MLLSQRLLADAQLDPALLARQVMQNSRLKWAPGNLVQQHEHNSWGEHLPRPRGSAALASRQDAGRPA